MPDPRLLGLFALATFVLTVTPGPGVLYVVGRSVGSGRRSGLASMLGIETGEAVCIVGAALGITALLAASSVALSVLRYGGAAYLVLLGIRAWRDAGGEDEAGSEASGGSNWAAYGRGLVVQLLNPKVAVLFLAYFPQFIRNGERVAPQVVVLGAIYIAIAMSVDTCYVLLASWLAERLARTARARRRRARISALTYVALAVAALALGDHGSAARAAAA
ncbi:MAG TPA: LysE family translocator [Streptosporangiaceae bacterium]|jgi:threonine/homoserine/homoserine lactone efflux protein|nr:LysE family translocator [Streptosporangiaceae bacterium]